MENKLDVFRQREFRRGLRHDQTKAERFLWIGLRNNRTGYKFYRQFSILNCLHNVHNIRESPVRDAR